MASTSENESFTGKVAFVTGAGSGIGRAAALAFASKDASAVAADISEQDNQDTARMIEESGGRALAVRCDVTRSGDVKAALDQLVAAFGDLDIAFNNAGVEQEPKATAEIKVNEAKLVDFIKQKGLTVTEVNKDEFRDTVIKTTSFETFDYRKADWERIQAVK